MPDAVVIVSDSVIRRTSPVTTGFSGREEIEVAVDWRGWFGGRGIACGAQLHEAVKFEDRLIMRNVFLRLGRRDQRQHQSGRIRHASILKRVMAADAHARGRARCGHESLSAGVPGIVRQITVEVGTSVTLVKGRGGCGGVGAIGRGELSLFSRELCFKA